LRLLRPVRAAVLLLGAVALVTCTVGSTVSPTPSALRQPKSSPSPPPLFGWAYEGSVRVNAVDPRTVILPDGSYRQIYGTWRSWQPAPGGPGARGLDPYYATAVSKDGIHWTEEGQLDVGYLVPVRLPDGRYRGYGNNFSAYVSDDVRNWRPDKSGPTRPPEPNPNPCGRFYQVSDVVVLSDQTFRMYYNCDAGQANPDCNRAQGLCLDAYVIDSATSKDGLIWQKDPGVRIDPRDGPEFVRDRNGKVLIPGDASHPRVVTLSDGSLKMFYWSGAAEIWSATSIDGLTWTSRKYEGILGGDPDAVVLPDGRIRLFVNGFLGLPQDFDGKTVGENQRIVSYLFGPVPYEITIDPERAINGKVTAKIEGSGPAVTLSAIGYSVSVEGNNALTASNPRVFDLVSDPASPVRVQFSTSSGSPPFTLEATLTVRYGINTIVVLVANNGGTQTLRPLRQSLP
jgi:hypothetical protein